MEATRKGGASMSNTATATDRDAITEVMQLYMDGAADGDVSKLEAAFHEQAWMFGEMGGQRLDMPIKEFFGLAHAQPLKTDDTFEARLVAVEQTDNAATAVVEEDGAWGSVSFVDYFTLARIDGDWKIVNKTFAHTGGEPPAG
jgi:putative lumazine-binding protein